MVMSKMCDIGNANEWMEEKLASSKKWPKCTTFTFTAYSCCLYVKVS